MAPMLIASFNSPCLELRYLPFYVLFNIMNTGESIRNSHVPSVQKGLTVDMNDPLLFGRSLLSHIIAQEQTSDTLPAAALRQQPKKAINPWKPTELTTL